MSLTLGPPRHRCRLVLAALLLPLLGHAQQPPAAALPPLGTPPPPAAVPRAEFAFEFHVTLAPVVVVGDTPFGHRQYIGITGGQIAGPKLQGEVVPGGWDYQLGLANGCNNLSADYFIRTADGTLVHVLNEGMFCPPTGPGGPRSFFRPRFEAPKGPYEWLNRSTFIATLESDAPPAPPGAPPALHGIRLKFYQIQ